VKDEGSILQSILDTTDSLTQFEAGISRFLDACARFEKSGEALLQSLNGLEATNNQVKGEAQACRQTIRDEECRWAQRSKE
jgi:hypothetical protein